MKESKVTSVMAQRKLKLNHRVKGGTIPHPHSFNNKLVNYRFKMATVDGTNEVMH